MYWMYWKLRKIFIFSLLTLGYQLVKAFKKVFLKLIFHNFVHIYPISHFCDSFEGFGQKTFIVTNDSKGEFDME